MIYFSELLYKWRKWPWSVPKIRGYSLNFPDWPPGARTANGTALCY
jgi:hypothetical protein